jgi:DNA polymerase III alpha subunit (gram-positive type)
MMSALLNLVVGDAFIGFIQQHANEFGGMVKHIILVSHNGKVFDIPFFIHQMDVHGIEQRLIEDGRFSFGMDTLQIAQKGIRDDKTGVGVPTAYNLQTLFQFVSGTLPSTLHRAMADVKATATVFQFPIFGIQEQNAFSGSALGKSNNNEEVQLLFLHLLNNWIMIWIRIRRTLDQVNLVFILFLLPLQQVPPRMKISPVLFLLVTHGKKS